MARSDYFKNINRTFERAESILTSNFDVINEDILQLINETLRQLDVQNGVITFNSIRNEAILNTLAERIRVDVLGSEYKGRVVGYMRQFQQITKFNSEFHRSVNNLTGIDTTLTNLQNKAVNKTIYDLLGNRMNVNFTDVLTNKLRDYAISGTNITEVEKALRNFVLGDKQRLGHLERYVKQIAGDGIRQYDGQIQAVFHQEYGLNAVSYEGSLIKDSRPQCVRWVKEKRGIIMVTDLKKEIEWAYNNGSGMIPDTTPESFYIYRGGYGCRHAATAINVAT